MADNKKVSDEEKAKILKFLAEAENKKKAEEAQAKDSWAEPTPRFSDNVGKQESTVSKAINMAGEVLSGIGSSMNKTFGAERFKDDKEKKMKEDFRNKPNRTNLKK